MMLYRTEGPCPRLHVRIETGKQITQHGYPRLKKNGSSQGDQKQQKCKNF